MTPFLGQITTLPFSAQTMPIIDGVLDLSTEPGAFVTWGLAAGVGLGSGIALILVTLGAYKILTSGGDPSKVKDGKDQIQNAIIGLLLIILSFAIVSTIFNLLGLGSIIKFG